MNQRPVFSPRLTEIHSGCCSMGNMSRRGCNRPSNAAEALHREVRLQRDTPPSPTSGCRANACARSAAGQRSGCGCGRQRNSSQSANPSNLPIVREEGCGCEGGQTRDCAKILQQIKTVDFALYEVILYLDAYPDHCDALELYHKLLQRRQSLIASYETACGPLTAFGNVSQTSWDWVKTPAPWEYSQN